MSEIKDRSGIEEKYKWDLSKIYKSLDEFNEDYEQVKELILDYKKYEGHVMDNASTFYNALIDNLKIGRRLEKLYTYASMKSDEDTSLNDAQELRSRVLNLYNLTNVNMYFFDTEMLKVSYSVIEKFYKEEPKLLEHEKNIKNDFRYKEHMLSDQEEKLISRLSKSFNNDEETYGFLIDSDMSFGNIIDEDGKEVELNDTNYSVYIRSKDRRIRKEAFELLYKSYKQFRNTISSLYNGYVKQNVTMAKVRNYPSAFEASLFNDDMDSNVYKILVETVHENMGVLYKYFDLIKEKLNLDELHLYDTYVELAEGYSKKYTFDEAKEIAIKALSVLGEDYVSVLKKEFEEKWIDIYPNKNKRGGAYSGGSYDTMPYILLNFQGDINDISTLVHESGHSIHSYYTRENQAYQYGDYPIFVAEVASQVNEILFTDYLLKNSNSKEEKLAVLSENLGRFKSSFYRQTMFAEFEKASHEIVENDDVITADKLCEKYYELNKLYFGDNVVVDDLIQYEWERVPHFYLNFYVYKYATGLAAACNIATRILNGEEGALENYLKMLKSGSSKSPLDTLKIAGVDMTDKKVYESAVEMFDKQIEQFKELSLKK